MINSVSILLLVASNYLYFDFLIRRTYGQRCFMMKSLLQCVRRVAAGIGFFFACCSAYAKPNFDLRFNWSHLPPQSPLAQTMTKVQTSTTGQQYDCYDTNTFHFFSAPDGGLGQNLHVWALDLCHAMEMNQLAIQIVALGCRRYYYYY